MMSVSEKLAKEQGKYDHLNKNQARKIDEYEDKLESLEERKQDLAKTLKSKSEYLDKLSTKEAVDEYTVNDLTNKKETKEKELEKLEQSTSELNKLNNEFLLEKNNVITNIKTIINDIYRKKNLTRQTSIQAPMQRIYNRKSKKETLVFKSQIGMKRKKSQQHTEFACQCTVF